MGGGDGDTGGLQPLSMTPGFSGVNPSPDTGPISIGVTGPRGGSSIGMPSIGLGGVGWNLGANQINAIGNSLSNAFSRIQGLGNFLGPGVNSSIGSPMAGIDLTGLIGANNINVPNFANVAGNAAVSQNYDGAAAAAAAQGALAANPDLPINNIDWGDLITGWAGPGTPIPQPEPPPPALPPGAPTPDNYDGAAAARAADGANRVNNLTNAYSLGTRFQRPGLGAFTPSTPNQSPWGQPNPSMMNWYNSRFGNNNAGNASQYTAEYLPRNYP